MPPSKNNIGVAIKYGSKAFFSFWYKPGAINFHIWINIMGLPIKRAVKKDRYLSKEDAKLIGEFLFKIQKELKEAQN